MQYDWLSSAILIVAHVAVYDGDVPFAEVMDRDTSGMDDELVQTIRPLDSISFFGDAVFAC